MLRGGGVAFGPRPRDFSTELQRKVYDLAVRTAVSARYRKGELLVVEGELGVDRVGGWALERYIGEVLGWNGLGGSLFVAGAEETSLNGFFGVLEKRREGRGVWVGDCDVKDLLSGKRVVIEREALNWLFRNHMSDLGKGGKGERWGGNLLEGVREETASV